MQNCLHRGFQMAKYIFITGYFDTVDLFSGEIIRFLEGAGNTCIILDRSTMKRDFQSLLYEMEEEPADAAIVFNNLGFNLGSEAGINIWDRFHIPYIDILMDHPFHFHPILPKLPQTTRLFCIDKNHVRYIGKYYPNITSVGFIPHGGCMRSLSTISENHRDIDILYAGNLSRTFIENLIPDLDAFGKIDGGEFFRNTLQRLLENPWVTTEDAILQELSGLSLDLSREEELHYINAFRFIDGFAVSYFREISVRILVENGFKVHVLGSGWEECDWADNENLTIVGKVNAREVLPFMKRSKIVLNTQTWFKEGCHDRVFNGMLAGATVVTDTSGYVKKSFSDKELSAFALENIEKLPYIVRDLLGDTDRLRAMAETGRNIAKKEHSWDNRISEIIGEL